MDVFLAVVAALFLLGGLAGAILPALPGPPLAWLGILTLHFTSYAQFSNTFLIVSAVLMVAITILDIYIPIWGTKRFGGTKAGVWGSAIGLILGLIFFPPFGAIIGPFAGAFIGEILFAGADFNTARRSAVGSFLGFLAGTFIKIIYASVLVYYYVAAMVQ